MTFPLFLTLVVMAVVFALLAKMQAKKPVPINPAQRDRHDRAWDDYATRIAAKQHPFN